MNSSEESELIQVKRNSRRLADLTIELDNKNEELRARLNDFEEKNQQLQSEVDVLQDFCHSRMESVAAEEENSWKVEKKSLVERIHQLDEDLAVERRKVQQLNGSQSSEIQSLRIKYDKLLKEHQECERRVVEFNNREKRAISDLIIKDQDLIKKNKRIEELEKEKDRMEKEMNRRIEALDSENKRIDRVSRTRQSDMDKKMNEIKKEMQREIHEKMKQITKMEVEHKEAFKVAAEANEKLEQLSIECNEKQNIIDSLNRSKASLLSQLSRQPSHPDNVKRLEENYNNVVIWANRLFEMFNACSEDLHLCELFKKQIKKSQYSLSQSEAIVRKLKEELKVLENRSVSLKAENDRLTSAGGEVALTEMESSLKKLQEQVESLNQQKVNDALIIEKLRGEAVALKEKNQPDPVVIRLMEENKNLRENVKEQTRLRNEDRRNTQNLEKQIEELKAKLNSTQALMIATSSSNQQQSAKQSKILVICTEDEKSDKKFSIIQQRRKTETSEEKQQAVAQECFNLKLQLENLRTDVDSLTSIMPEMTRAIKQRLFASGMVPSSSQNSATVSTSTSGGSPLARLSDEIVALKQEKLTLLKQLEETREFCHKCVERQQRALNSLVDNQESSTSSSQMLAKYRRDLSEANAERTKLDSLIQSLTQEKRDLKEENFEKRRVVDKLTAERDTLKKEVSDLQAEVATIPSLQLNLDELERCVDMRDKEIEEHKQKFKELNDENEQIKTSMSRLQSSSVSLKKIEAKDVELTSLKKLLASLTSQKDIQLEKVNQLQTEFNQKSEAYDALKTELQRLETSLNSAEVNVEQLQKNLSAEQKESERLRTENHIYSVEVARLQAQEKDYQMQIVLRSPSASGVSKIYEDLKADLAAVVEERNKTDMENAKLKTEINFVNQQLQKLTAEKQQLTNENANLTKKLDALKRSHADLSNRFTESKNDSVEWQRKYEVELEKNRQLNIAMQNERAEYESTIQDRDRMVEETQLSRTSQARESRDLYERKVKALEESHNTKLSDVKQQNRSLIEERKKKETEMQRKLNLQEEEIVRLAEQLKSANSSLEIELDRFKKVSTENAELKYKLEVSKRDCERTAERAKYSANISIFKENSFKETIEELTADKEALQKEKETLESIVIKLKVQISELKRKSGESGSDSGTEQRKAIRDLEKKVKMSEKEIKETKDKLKAKEQEINTLQEQLRQAMMNFQTQQNAIIRQTTKASASSKTGQSANKNERRAELMTSFYKRRISELEKDLQLMQRRGDELMAAVERINNQQQSEIVRTLLQLRSRQSNGLRT